MPPPNKGGGGFCAPPIGGRGFWCRQSGLGVFARLIEGEVLSFLFLPALCFCHFGVFSFRGLWGGVFYAYWWGVIVAASGLIWSPFDRISSKLFLHVLHLFVSVHCIFPAARPMADQWLSHRKNPRKIVKSGLSHEQIQEKS